MAQYRTLPRRLSKPGPAKTPKKRLTAPQIAKRYMELVRLREVLKAESVAR